MVSGLLGIPGIETQRSTLGNGSGGVGSEQWLMLIYRFTIHNVDGSDREEAGRMALCDDDAARAFGKAVIRDLMIGDATRYAGWTMNITKGGHAVCCLPFGSPLNT